VIRWTDGRGLVATGTPWDPVPCNGVRYAFGQANNALVYPGIGLGTIVSRASHVMDGMLLAAQAVAGLVDVHQPGAGLLPDIENMRATSATVAVAGARLDDPVQSVQDAMWQPVYLELELR
jgi:malate dehydrogenase (oxaloacetate-decarboxylating)